MNEHDAALIARTFEDLSGWLGDFCVRLDDALVRRGLPVDGILPATSEPRCERIGRYLAAFAENVRELGAFAPMLERHGAEMAREGVDPDACLMVRDEVLAAVRVWTGPMWTEEHESVWGEALDAVTGMVIGGLESTRGVRTAA